MKNKTVFKINLIYFITLTCVAVVFAFGYMGIFNNETLTTILIQAIIIFAIPLLLYTLTVSKNLKQTFSDTGFKKISVKVLAISILLGIILYFINTFVADFFQSIVAFLGYETIESGETVKVTYEFLFKQFIFTCIFPAICEEFLHRGIMLHACKKVQSPKICLIVSSILFGLMHLNINQFFYAAILGGLMGYVAIVSNSIFPTMIIHFMNNFLGTYFYYGKVLKLPLATFVANLESMLLSNVLVFILVSTLFIVSLVYLYSLLTKIIARETRKNIIKTFLANLKLNGNTNYQFIQIKTNWVNDFLNSKKQKTNLLDNLFLIASFVLGGVLTIFSFIWGVI